MNNNRIRIPCIVNVETAVRIYDEKPRLRNADIMELFGCGLNKSIALRRYVDFVLAEKGMMAVGDATVNTADAFDAWNLDIDDLRKRFDNIMKHRKRTAL